MSHKRHYRPPPTQRQQLFDVGQALPMAINLFRNGWNREADQLYRRILQIQPANPDALHFLGSLLY